MAAITRVLLALLLQLSQIAPVLAQEQSRVTIRFFPGNLKSNPPEISYVEFTGQIRPEGVSELRKALDEALLKTNVRTWANEPKIVLKVNSPGGNVEAGISMGKMLRAYAVDIRVYPRELCASACVLLLAGAVERLAFDGARIGIHRPRFDANKFAQMSRLEADRKYQQLAATVEAYLAEMGMPSALYSAMMRISSGKIIYLTEKQAEELSLVGEDSAYAEWARARAQQINAPSFLEGLDKYIECLNSGGSKCTNYIPRR